MRIAILPGDGIGTEVTAQALKVLRAAVGPAARLELTEAPIGAAGIAAAGKPLPDATLAIARKAEAILSVPRAGRVRRAPLTSGRGAASSACGRNSPSSPISGPRSCSRSWSGPRPEAGDRRGAGPHRAERVQRRTYYGEPRGIIRTAPASVGRSTRCGTRNRRSSASRTSPFGRARRRRKKVCSVDKANVLETPAVAEAVTEWDAVSGRGVAQALRRCGGDDADARPKQFDVIVTGNMFGESCRTRRPC